MCTWRMPHKQEEMGWMLLFIIRYKEEKSRTVVVGYKKRNKDISFWASYRMDVERANQGGCMKQLAGASIIGVPQKGVHFDQSPRLGSSAWNCQDCITLYFLFFLLLQYTYLMDMHTRAIEAFKRSEFHTRNGHRKPGMYDSAGLGSRERQGRPFVLPDDKAPPIRSESIASSTSFDSAYSGR